MGRHTVEGHLIAFLQAFSNSERTKYVCRKLPIFFMGGNVPSTIIL
jgi:hypothetical protein